MVSNLGLKIQQLWEFMYKYMYEHVFSFLWDKGPRVQLVGHVVKCVKTCQTITRGAVPFYICTVNRWIAAFLQSLWYCYFHFTHSDRCIVTCHFLNKIFLILEALSFGLSNSNIFRQYSNIRSLSPASVVCTVEVG